MTTSTQPLPVFLPDSATAPVWGAREPVTPAAKLLERLLGLERLRSVYAALADDADPRPFAERALERLNATVELVGAAPATLPAGPLIVAANHPFGGIEGLAMLSLIERHRPDVKIMANHWLGQLAELRPRLILVDPFGRPDSAAFNLAPLRACDRWLRGGGALGLFPAGEVASFALPAATIREPEWQPTLGWLARRSRATVLPLYFEGANGPLFHLAGLLAPHLRTALLPRELANPRPRLLRVAIGAPIPFSTYERIPDEAELTRYFRSRVALLGPRPAPRRPGRGAARPARPVAPQRDRARQAAEIGWLPREHCLLSSGHLSVYVAGAGRVPAILQEIGRLRELTFRDIGEGTGKELDLDRHDELYQHLFVWNHKTGEVVGAYRLGLTDALLREYGPRSLYTCGLFHYRRGFLETLGPALELGRSFVRKEYQKGYLPLLLLWQGIGCFVATRPRYRYLFGTVSMSASYTLASRELVVRFFRQQSERAPDADAIRPRRPFPLARGGLADPAADSCGIPDLETLSATIRELEPDGKALPILFRQYRRLGGRVLGCNVDPGFNMALDALTLVDLPQADPRLLAQYLGDGTQNYLRYHGVHGREQLKSVA